MSDDRSRIFSAIREALGPLQAAGKATAYPEYSVDVLSALPRLKGEDQWTVFARNLKNVNGRAMSDVAELAAYLQSENAAEGYCDPTLIATIAPALSGVTLHGSFERAELERYTFGITRASGIIVESGTVILKDRETSNRLGALAPWVHIAVIFGDTPVYHTISEAIAALGDDPNTIFVTGPSKTADVEGILIEGVHGPGQQICLRLS
ncbi:MAG: LUD domain-containing protein [Verrucomicrobiota bacterium JB022]|nr:LUD domain-containing protein [Verrucomicrobiota bacterium JB022]